MHEALAKCRTAPWNGVGEGPGAVDIVRRSYRSKHSCPASRTTVKDELPMSKEEPLSTTSVPPLLVPFQGQMPCSSGTAYRKSALTPSSYTAVNMALALLPSLRTVTVMFTEPGLTAVVVLHTTCRPAQCCMTYTSFTTLSVTPSCFNHAIVGGQSTHAEFDSRQKSQASA